MNIIACVTSLSFLLLSFFMNRNKKSISPIVLFFALWFFIIFLSILNLYNILKPSTEAYFLIILMLGFFYIGHLLSRIKINKKNKTLDEKIKNDTEEVKEIKPLFKVFYFLSFLIILFNIIDFIIIIKELIKGTPMWQIRNWTLEPYGSINPILGRRSFIEELIRSIILTPFAMLIPPITSYYFFNIDDNKQRYKLLINSLIVLITTSIAGGGGRLEFIYYFGSFLLEFYIIYKNKEISKDIVKKYKKIIICILVFGIVFVALYTIFRTGIGNIIKQVYTYFALPPTLLSIWLPNLKNIDYTYGMTTFFGLHSYFFRVFDTIGLDFLIPNIYNQAYTHILNAEIFKTVGYGIGNAFVTPIYYFMVDGGYIFVCIASLFFGYFVDSLHNKFEENINARTFVVYTLIMYGTFLTFIRIQTAIPAYIISFIFTFIVLREVKTTSKKNYSTDEFKYYKKQENQELISVVIPVYKVEKYLEKCIESLLKQTYTKLEIILVDDGSPDNCGKICDDYAQKYSQIKVIHKENGGLSDARNTGIIHSKGSYITFIDSDDYVDEEYIEVLYNSIISNDADLSVVAHRVLYEKNCIDKSTSEMFCANSEIILEKILYDDGVDLSAWGKLYKISLFDEIKFPKGRLYEDSATTYKLIDSSEKIVVYSKALYNYVIRNDSISNNEFHEKKMDLITSTKEMTDFIKNKYPDLENACDRRLMYSYLSTLTQLAMSNKKFPEEQAKMMNYIKNNRLKILRDNRIPKRDKIALISTMFGFNTFRIMWNTYRKNTGRK